MSKKINRKVRLIAKRDVIVYVPEDMSMRAIREEFVYNSPTTHMPFDLKEDLTVKDLGVVEIL